MPSVPPIPRPRWVERIRARLRDSPVVALLGARQVGKSTLAGDPRLAGDEPVTRFDLESPRDRARLAEPMLTLERLRGLVVLDEIQLLPELFPILRVLADRPDRPARFLLLGSASPSIIRRSSESLAGRMAHLDLDGFDLSDVGPRSWRKLWLRGGFPRAFLASSDSASLEWRRDYLRSYVERDLPQLGYPMSGDSMRRFLSMVSHYHGQTWNASEVGRAFGASYKTADRSLDLLCGSFLARRLPPWHENLGKRLVKSPKVFLRDSGLFHALLSLRSEDDLLGHPKAGASFEGFAIEQAIHRLEALPEECHFWATHQGAELDLLVVRGNRRIGVEVKLSDSPTVTRSIRQAIEDLGLERVYVIHAGALSYPLAEVIFAISIDRLLEDIRPLDERVIAARRDD